MGTSQSISGMYGEVLRQKTPHMAMNGCSPILSGTSFSSENCCISFRLQPSCTGNRHFHAYLYKQGLAAYMTIIDLTHDKKSTCAIYDDKEIEVLPHKLLQVTDLHVCNVVSYIKGIAVVQLFCVDVMKFIIINMKEKLWIMTYNKKYTSESKLYLYECQFSRNNVYLLIKQNQIHATLYNRCVKDCEGISLLKLDLTAGTSTEISCPSLNKYISVCNHRVAVAFDPRSTNDLVVFVNHLTDRGTFGLYKVEKDFFLFTIAIFIKENPALPGKYQHLQFLKDGSAVILSVLGTTGFHPQSVSVLCWNRFVTVYWFDPNCFDKIGSFTYISPLGYEQYAPLICNSSKYACCGTRIYSLEEMIPGNLIGVKTLKRLCHDLIVDGVLPEDLGQLPLPKPLISYLENA